MKKWALSVGFTFFLYTIGSAQTLFTYGNYRAEASEFLRAYNKNNAQPGTDRAKSMRDYLELYINSRLKIREAHDRGFDTLPQIALEVDNLRTQIIDNYMSDPETISRLTQEAFQRSQHDLHVAHIFISFANAVGVLDTAAVNLKLAQVTKRLGKEDFLSVAQQLSDDPEAKTTKGDLGYLTVFTLPYGFENIVYNTAAGKYSAPIRSNLGYHIFKVIDIRPAAGKIKAQQILLAVPPDADAATRNQVKRLADSLYARIMAGDDFGALASSYSNDNISAPNAGKMPDISVGQYDNVFENVLWGLPKDGAVSKPFQTSHGYHILKRVAIVPVITDAGNTANNDDLKQRIMIDDRWKTAKDFIYGRVAETPGFKRGSYSRTALWGYSDSLLDRKPAGEGRTLNDHTILFSIGDSVITTQQWINYAQAFRYKTDRSGIKPYDQVMDEFEKAVQYDYYRNHLEHYNEEFKNQMEEFRDGNLFFEIMQEEIWNKAQSDSAALLSLYKKNLPNYNWKQSADAVIFFCSDEAVANKLYDALKKDPANWKVATDGLSEKVVADSARYEWEQIPNLNKIIPKPGLLTAPLVNKTDNTVSFAYIQKVYSSPTPRSFTEAKGLVINDYQAQLEEQWIKTLRARYPVSINQKVLAEISK